MIEIEVPNIDDAEEIAKVKIKTWKNAYVGLMSSSYLKSLSVKDESKKWIRRLSKDFSKFILFVAREDNKIIGFIWGGKNQELGSIYESSIFAFYVLPEYQRTGIGKRLFYAFVKESISRNMNSMCLWILKGSASSEFYKHMGGRYIKTETKKFPKNGKNENIEYEEDMFGYDNLIELII